MKTSDYGNIVEAPFRAVALPVVRRTICAPSPSSDFRAAGPGASATGFRVRAAVPLVALDLGEAVPADPCLRWHQDDGRRGCERRDAVAQSARRAAAPCGRRACP
jgi:hypothetical protein